MSDSSEGNIRSAVRSADTEQMLDSASEAIQNDALRECSRLGLSARVFRKLHQEQAMRSENTSAKPTKFCQECKRQYPGDGLIYCPFDGAALVDLQQANVQSDRPETSQRTEQSMQSGSISSFSTSPSFSHSNPGTFWSAPDSSPSDPSYPNHYSTEPQASHGLIEMGSIVAGRYEVLSKPTIGKTAAIYRARHTLMNKEVALKVLLRGMLSDQSTVARFQNEAKIVSGLAHPNVVTIHDFGITEDGLPYMLLNYVEGPTLADALKLKRAVDVQQALNIILQVCKGLSYIHQHLKIHGGIMPKHILLTPTQGSYTATVIDFSQAQSLGVKQSIQPSWDLVSNPPAPGLYYLAPEQLKGGVLDDRTDIYALGCMMFEMLAGSPPFTGNNGMEVRTKHLSQPPQTLANLSRGVPKLLDQILSKCLEKDPDKRFQTVEKLMRELYSLSG